MSCNIPVQEGVRKPADCTCYSAVMRTYSALQDEPHIVAMEAAIRVYRFHHPEDNKGDAHLTVERWLAEGHVH